MVRENSPTGTFCVPLNIMCSSMCATPVVPLTSSMLPARYHTIDTATGERWSSLTITVIPLASARCAIAAAKALVPVHRRARATIHDRSGEFVVDMLVDEPGTNRIELPACLVLILRMDVTV